MIELIEMTLIIIIVNTAVIYPLYLILSKIPCESGGYHKTGSSLEFNGNLKSKCKKCGKEIIMDSQGNWF